MLKKIIAALSVASILATVAPTMSEAAASPQTKAIAAAKTQMGVPYKWGGMSRKGYDCSGLIKYSYAKAGKTLPRTTVEMYKKGSRVSSIKSLKPGDLMFFAPNKASRVTHASIYIGSGKMIHSSSSKGVSIASTSNTYWKPKFVGAKRL
ncbi:peptidase P60 [Bacillus sp. M6-12]|uniref:C40 family peptidase n=1 Tax=Bacillus sp. M6-12 TaxID=2054166 RepID=UPI000C791CE0|nr:C40 family peptidase [Bacillus sp. M6-12]PLS17112.1 peptidase P60 [Bacillus sp. M6-12]